MNRWNKVLMNHKAITWIYFWGCMDYFGCSKVNLKWIGAIIELDRGSTVYGVSR